MTRRINSCKHALRWRYKERMNDSFEEREHFRFYLRNYSDPNQANSHPNNRLRPNIVSDVSDYASQCIGLLYNIANRR